jgi:catechol-2,3-dioxygenase
MSHKQATSASADISVPGKAQQLGHLVLYVSDLQRSMTFYADILGWPVGQVASQFPAVLFRASHIHHDLLLIEVGRHAAPIPPGRRVGMYHFGVKVGDSDDDLRAVLARIRAHPGIATVQGAVDCGFLHSLYVHDPDGNEVELYVDVPGWDWTGADLLGAPRRELQL